MPQELKADGPSTEVPEPSAVNQRRKHIQQTANAIMNKYALFPADLNLWSLCPCPGNRQQTDVVFNISAEATRSSPSGPWLQNPI